MSGVLYLICEFLYVFEIFFLPKQSNCTLHVTQIKTDICRFNFFFNVSEGSINTLFSKIIKLSFEGINTENRLVALTTIAFTQMTYMTWIEWLTKPSFHETLLSTCVNYREKASVKCFIKEKNHNIFCCFVQQIWLVILQMPFLFPSDH